MCGIFGFYYYNVKHAHAEVLHTLFEGLRRLEYRGYDSAGVAVDWPVGPSSHRKPVVIKAKGKVEELVRLTAEQAGALGGGPAAQACVAEAGCGIAHTRWATHGPPCARNAHPHVSSSDHEFMVVHNGTITNFRALKEFLSKEGETFESDTDTEVIPKLCRFLYNRLPEPIPFQALVCEVVKHLEGAYALLIKSALYPGELVACRKGSPLILGVKVLEATAPAALTPLTPRLVGGVSAGGPLSARGGGAGQLSARGVECLSARGLRAVTGLGQAGASEGPVPPLAALSLREGGGPLSARAKGRSEGGSLELFFASEASAVVEHTKQVIYLEDNDIVHVREGTYTVYNWVDVDSPSVEVRRAVQTLSMEVSQIMKGGYKYFMEKEIFEQPETLLQTMQGRMVGGESPSVRLGGLADLVPTILRSRRLMFVGSGTSFHACLAARQTMEELTELPCVLELSIDLLDRRCPIFRDDTCVFVSQSGETADTLRALEFAKKQGALCVGVTNTVGSAIDRATHAGLHINAGAEIGVASTKAYTSQIVALTMLALALSSDSARKGRRRREIAESLAALPEAAKRTLELDAGMQRLAAELRDEQSLLVFGRGRDYATAVEAALKVKEVSYMHSEGINAGEMKHGPLALVDDKLPILVVATQDSLALKMQGVIQQLMARKARLIVLCNEGDRELDDMLNDAYPTIKVPRLDEAVQPILNVLPLQLLSFHLTILRGYNVDQPRNLAKSVTITEE